MLITLHTHFLVLGHRLNLISIALHSLVSIPLRVMQISLRPLFYFCPGVILGFTLAFYLSPSVTLPSLSLTASLVPCPSLSPSPFSLLPLSQFPFSLTLSLAPCPLLPPYHLSFSLSHSHTLSLSLLSYSLSSIFLTCPFFPTIMMSQF